MVDDRGHRVLPHTADAVIEAWGSTAAACYAEAVAAFVDVFAIVDADQAKAGGSTHQSFVIGAGDPPRLLVLLLEEVLGHLDADGLVPIGVEVATRDPGHLSGTFTMVPLDRVELVGSTPKGVSYDQLELGPRGDGSWRCHAVVDV